MASDDDRKIKVKGRRISTEFSNDPEISSVDLIVRDPKKDSERGKKGWETRRKNEFAKGYTDYYNEEETKRKLEQEITTDKMIDQDINRLIREKEELKEKLNEKEIHEKVIKEFKSGKRGTDVQPDVDEIFKNAGIDKIRDKTEEKEQRIKERDDYFQGPSKVYRKSLAKKEPLRKFRNLFGKAKGGVKVAGEFKPTKSTEDLFKLVAPIVAIIGGIIGLRVYPSLWIIEIPAIIVGLGYLFIIFPEMEKFGFKQKIGFLLLVAGGLLAGLVGNLLYGGILLGLGAVFIVYDLVPKGKGKFGAKIFELCFTLALLIVGVPAFLSWSGITISLVPLIIFSALNTFLLFMFWSWGGGKSMKETLEEQKIIAETEAAKAKTKEAEAQEEAIKKGEEKKEPEKSENISENAGTKNIGKNETEGEIETEELRKRYGYEEEGDE